jgi:hypothetical protein
MDAMGKFLPDPIAQKSSDDDAWDSSPYNFLFVLMPFELLLWVLEFLDRPSYA